MTTTTTRTEPAPPSEDDWGGEKELQMMRIRMKDLLLSRGLFFFLV